LREPFKVYDWLSFTPFVVNYIQLFLVFQVCIYNRFM